MKNLERLVYLMSSDPAFRAALSTHPEEATASRGLSFSQTELADALRPYRLLFESPRKLADLVISSGMPEYWVGATGAAAASR